MSFIQTFTGRRVDPLALTAADVSIFDIAHALAYSSRYNGHAREFYSIAQHSVLVSELLELRGLPYEVQAWGLMHDAAEAYLGDVVTPLKRYLFTVDAGGAFNSFRVDEALALHAIAEALRLPWPVPSAINAADRELLACEAAALFGGDLSAWRLQFEPGAVTVEPWPAAEAERRFLARWWELRVDSRLSEEAIA